MAKKKASKAAMLAQMAQKPTADYTALNQQKLKELEEADKYRREQAARKNNRGANGKSILSWSGRNV